MNAYAPLGKRDYRYCYHDGQLNKAAIRAEIDRRVQREWVLSGGESDRIRRSETRYILQIALQQRDATRDALRRLEAQSAASNGRAAA